MTQFLFILVILVSCLVFGQFLICVWNEINLEMRQHHRMMYKFYLNEKRFEMARYHLDREGSIQKWFIRFDRHKTRHLK